MIFLETKVDDKYTVTQKSILSKLHNNANSSFKGRAKIIKDYCYTITTNTEMIKIHLSKLLGKRRMTQAELANKANIRPATINEMQHELVERVSLDYLSRIFQILNIKIEDLLEYILDKKS